MSSDESTVMLTIQAMGRRTEPPKAPPSPPPQAAPSQGERPISYAATSQTVPAVTSRALSAEEAFNILITVEVAKDGTFGSRFLKQTIEDVFKIVESSAKASLITLLGAPEPPAPAPILK